MNRSSTGFQIIFGLKLTGVYALNVFQPLKKSNRLGFMLGNSLSLSTFYVHVAPRISSIVCPSESNIEGKLVQDYVHTSHKSHKLSETRTSV